MSDVPYQAPVMPKLEIPYEVKDNDQRLSIRAELYRATEGSYANYLQARMSKLFQYEIPAGFTLAKAVDLIEKANRSYDHYYFIVKSEGGKIVITGVEGNQRLFYELKEKTGENIKHEASWTTLSSVTEKSKDGELLGNVGQRGFGTYDLLIQNNRLPVPEKTGYFSPSKHEMPWPGKTYKMFEFVYNSGIRNIGGSGVVGAYERSMTTHRFWVNTDLIVKGTNWVEFEKAIYKAVGKESEHPLYEASASGEKEDEDKE
jgi:hypothetical protein